MAAPQPLNQADEMRDAVAKLYTPWKDRKHKPKRRHKNFDESIGNDAQRVFHVRPDDILFGRGRAYQNHPGNRRMRAIVFKHKPQYDKVHRSRKREVVEAAYSEITEQGARFLYKAKDEQDQDSYAIVNMQTALQKVRNTLGAKLSAKEKREAALKMLDDQKAVTSSALSSPTSKTAKTAKSTTTTSSSSTVASKIIDLTSSSTAMGAGKLGAFELPSSTARTSSSSTNFKMKEDLGPELFSLRQQEPSSMLGLMPRHLSAAAMLPSPLPVGSLMEASLLTPGAAAAGLYPRSHFAASLDPMMMTTMGPSSSLLYGAAAAGRFPSPMLPYSSLLTGRPTGLLGSASASLALEEEQRQQILASREASIMAATRGAGSGAGLRSPYL